MSTIGKTGSPRRTSTFFRPTWRPICGLRLSDDWALNDKPHSSGARLGLRSAQRDASSSAGSGIVKSKRVKTPASVLLHPNCADRPIGSLNRRLEETALHNAFHAPTGDTAAVIQRMRTRSARSLACRRTRWDGCCHLCRYPRPIAQSFISIVKPGTGKCSSFVIHRRIGLTNNTSPPCARSLRRCWRHSAARQSRRQPGDHRQDRIGARLVQGEGYWGEALDYHLGLLYAHIGEPEKAAYHFERSDTLPIDGGDQVFSEPSARVARTAPASGPGEAARNAVAPHRVHATFGQRFADADPRHNARCSAHADQLRTNPELLSGAALAELLFPRRRGAARPFWRGAIQPEDAAGGRRAAESLSVSAIRGPRPLR